MTDPRPELQALCAHWLQVRADVRALVAVLTAAQHRQAAQARGSADPAVMAILADQLATERAALDQLAARLDDRIAEVRAQCAALEAGYSERLVASARGR